MERYVSFLELRKEIDVGKKKRQTQVKKEYVRKELKDMRYCRKYCDQFRVSSTYKARI